MVYRLTYVFFFFFKKRAAYEMRISNCSSDVCSSDLSAARHLVGGHSRPGRHGDLGHRIRQREIRHLGGIIQALAVLSEVKDLAVIGALALENAGGIMQRMGQHMQLGVAERDKLTVEPEKNEIGRASCRERVCQNV